MSRLIEAYLDDATETRMAAISQQLNQSIEDLCRMAVEEVVLKPEAT